MRGIRRIRGARETPDTPGPTGNAQGAGRRHPQSSQRAGLKPRPKRNDRRPVSLSFFPFALVVLLPFRLDRFPPLSLFLPLPYSALSFSAFGLFSSLSLNNRTLRRPLGPKRRPRPRQPRPRRFQDRQKRPNKPGGAGKETEPRRGAGLRVSRNGQGGNATAVSPWVCFARRGLAAPLERGLEPRKKTSGRKGRAAMRRAAMRRATMRRSDDAGRRRERATRDGGGREEERDARREPSAGA